MMAAFGGLILLFLPIFLLLSCAEARPSPGDSRAVLMNSIDVLTFHKGQRTIQGGRTPPEPQILCRGPYCGTSYEPTTIVCQNIGIDTLTSDPSWKCQGNQRMGLWLGDYNVICEGFRDRDDPWVLRGSCNFEFNLRGIPFAPPEDPRAILFYFFLCIFFCCIIALICTNSPSKTERRFRAALDRDEERRAKKEEQRREEERGVPLATVVPPPMTTNLRIEVTGGGGVDPSDYQRDYPNTRRRGGRAGRGRSSSGGISREEEIGGTRRREDPPEMINKTMYYPPGPVLLPPQPIGGTQRREETPIVPSFEIDPPSVGGTLRREDPPVVQPVRAPEVIPNLSSRYNEGVARAASDLFIERVMETGGTKRREEAQEESSGETKRREDREPMKVGEIIKVGDTGGTKRREETQEESTGGTKRRG